MFKAVVKKEWLKIRFVVAVLLFISLGILAQFIYQLNFSFSTIEPESMMWYRFAHLSHKPYGYFMYLFLLFALAISLFQYIPERIKNRVKILSHLPLSLKKLLFWHMSIGVVALILLCTVTSAILLSFISLYYPNEARAVLLKDVSFYTLSAVLLYLCASALIVEQKKSYLTVKFIIISLSMALFFNTTNEQKILFWVILCFIFYLMALDSFYSIKMQRLKKMSYLFTFIVLSVTMPYFALEQYNQNYKKEFTKYYIFYSSILKEFVYQKNFGDHHFEYGIQNKIIFNQEEYESYLPFVYWRNLDIQKKLPLIIDEEVFTKERIKKTRLSFSYSPTLLQAPLASFYPFLNPNTQKGMISFPEEILIFTHKDIKIYDYDNGVKSQKTALLREKIKGLNVKLPLKSIWGKTTNMKPFDLGYFLLDANNQLFQLKQENDIMTLKSVATPKNADFIYMHISENKQKHFVGYAIDAQSNFYLIDYNNLSFHPITLEGFNYKTMRLQLIANAKYYLIRYDDTHDYYASVFDKEFNKLDEALFK